MAKKKPRSSSMFEKPKPDKFMVKMRLEWNPTTNSSRVAEIIDPPPEYLEAIENERRRFDLVERLTEGLATCAEYADRYYRAEDLSADREVRLRHIDLPADAPDQAVDALRTARIFLRIFDELKMVGDLTLPVARAICLAMDSGMMMQRLLDRDAFESSVAAAKASASARADNVERQKQAVGERQRIASEEFLYLWKTWGSGKPTKSAVMAHMLRNADGKEKYGSEPTLKRLLRGIRIANLKKG